MDKLTKTACLLTTLSVLTTLFGGCATSGAYDKTMSLPSSFTPTRPTQKNEQREFQEIEGSYANGSVDATTTQIQDFIQHYPKSSLLPAVENLFGLLLLKDQKPTEAITHFKKAIALNPTSQRFNTYISFNIASAQFESAQFEESIQTLGKINLELLDAENTVKFHRLKATLFEKKELPLKACEELLKAAEVTSPIHLTENRKTLRDLLDRQLQIITELDLLEGLYREHENSPIIDTVLLRLGHEELRSGHMGAGEAHLKTLLSKFSETPSAPVAKEYLKTFLKENPVENRVIGVLLPVKGRFAEFGLRSLQGIQLALDLFNPSNPDPGISLIIEDSGDQPEQAIQALNRLVFKHHVVGVIGPILSKGADRVTARAQELGVPLISLVRRAGSEQDFIFQGGLTPDVQTHQLAKYGIETLNARRFAILYPDDKMGLEMSQSFWTAVESLGGEIVGIESYQPGQTDFRIAVDKLSGLYYKTARQNELNFLEQDRTLNNITKRSRKTEQYYELKPVVDYDAVFIPDNAQVAGQVIPTFAYRDVENVRFFGTSSWNSPDLLTRVRAYGSQVLFVDAFFSQSSSPKIKHYTELYKNTFNQEPTSFDALAYDAALILRKCLGENSSRPTRVDLRDELRSIRNFEGVTGTISVKNGQFYRDLSVLTLSHGQFKELN